MNQRLAQIRAKKGMGVAEFAEFLGVHRNTYRSWEELRSDAGIEALTAVALDGWNANWVLTGEGPERLEALSDAVSAASHAVKQDVLIMAIQLASEALEGKGRTLPPEKRAEMIGVIYDLLEEGMPEAKVLRFARAAAA